MKVTFSAILTVTDALKAVEQNGYALRYVRDLSLFIALANTFGIATDKT